MVEPTNYVVISYWPLINIDQPQIFNDKPIERIQEFLENSVEVHIDGCMWLLDEDMNPVPVLIMEQAVEVYEHLMRWCEQKPSEWFSVCIRPLSDNRYVVCLVPNINKSIERFRLSCFLLRGYVPTGDAKFTVLYHALQFISEGNTAYMGLKDKITPTLSIGFVDTNDVNKHDPSKTDFSSIKYIEQIPQNTELELNIE